MKGARPAGAGVPSSVRDAAVLPLASQSRLYRCTTRPWQHAHLQTRSTNTTRSETLQHSRFPPGVFSSLPALKPKHHPRFRLHCKQAERFQIVKKESASVDLKNVRHVPNAAGPRSEPRARETSAALGMSLKRNIPKVSGQSQRRGRTANCSEAKTGRNRANGNTDP
ncbi:hypothetical protein AOLI_G00102690 [Acnodon oligacanthus]